ncbi:hypothetical protein COU14_02280 [Candidatus Kaiserbacteria bacterium CG10_big_fil_rev_8_21_14_0_10_44_10]|uniref:DNA polymerase III subunit delta n=1 Tax=Candidatus Kaiserbacteria bacterium CG10_big_fil_rev_8_21_14_0_10_44_10 TaxID=1974606 RepID=A0A2H0UJD3_9BACT|nr:MAG: hypothetical protein COU14_02280 [Candidatus Kaiserbacteria bacterium CG10_big_fil_rev_8_21_14_0_10_44_10]
MIAHAQLLIADSLENASLPEELKSETTDTRHLFTDNLSIDEARWLVKESAKKALGAGLHQFVIVAKGLTNEAQNALLKLFEEPPENTVFYLIVPHESILIPTLRSRLIVTGNTSTESKSAVEFLELSVKERIDTVAKLAKDDPQTLGQIVRELGEKHLAELSPDAKRSLLLCEKYVYNRGASRKMLLEELALSLNT